MTSKRILSYSHISCEDDLDTFIPYLNKIKKHTNHLTRPLNSTDISIVSPEINNFCYIKKVISAKLATLDFRQI